ncbi:MAG: acyl-CoA thioesterase [Bacteroidales bacterium]|jgi:acyl-CoA thioester hydrolase|nr:acyl-CoA thioesterase [Bacteroidales bacterium]
MSHFNHTTPIQIRMSDLDPFVHVNNGSQCHFYDIGRTHYVENLNGKIDWGTLDLVLAHLEIDFKSPIRIHDEIVCDTKIYAIGNKSMKMEQQLREVNTGEIKSVCRSVLSGFDRKTGQSMVIKEEYKTKIIAFEKNDSII